MKKFIDEFKEFIMQGNVINLAVGIIIGSAFTAIVNSLVDDIINPIIGLFLGHMDFSQLYVALDGKSYDSLDAAEAAGAAVLKYGSFISQVINFIIIALVVFIIIKIIMGMIERMKKEQEEEENTKVCPFCQSEIDILATRCPNCTSQLPEIDVEELKAKAEIEEKAETE